MRVIAGTGPGLPFAARAMVAATFAFLALTAISPLPMSAVVPAAALAFVVAAFHRVVLNWRVVVAALLVLIMFIPMRRYTLPFGAFGFQLEPYRVFVGVLAAGWGISLLIDRRVLIKGSGLEGPIVAIALSIVCSLMLNADAIARHGLQNEIVKAGTFFATFFVVFYLVVSLLRPADIRPLVQILVAAGALVALLAIYESRSGSNLFDRLSDWIPFLQNNVAVNKEVDLNGFARGDKLRTYASAEHPIALAAALCMLFPLSLALAITGKRHWWLAVFLLAMGGLATLSRTGVVMLLVVGLVFIWLRPGQTVRMWWAVFPLVIVIHAVMPHTLGILKSSFFPAGGLVAEQHSSAGSATAGGRAADFGPVMERVKRSPVVGVGYATTVLPTPGEAPEELPGSLAPPTTRILDNQWLGTLLETGFLGVFAWLWLFLRFIRRLGRAAKRDESDEGWLLVGLVASITAATVGMFTYDAFAFVQATFITFILLAFGAVLGKPILAGKARAPARG
jgi:hypothetical protein